ncbi:phosphonate ABC transporter ATP-binding protein [Marinobacter zhejiangensis]|uniref:Phosphonate transport system ATP-binding protein n=1 Tax=Marinobacter zhejiangensis TaxID=488535 RepID=A0A1I4RZC1_9GAMM|nr:ATP-binding cassette domain-containing protein [Marinobacter zhejiangensis]SFM57340.1 phosphonate transport system ATP-binding protein [Marinobacter zhejiangensis]
MSVIELSNLSASFGGRRVLGPLSLTVADGERVALVGRSGAGKSTLLKLAWQQCGSDIALVPQDLGLVPALPVFHNVYMGRLNQRSSWYNALSLVRPFKKDRAEVCEVLQALAISDKQWVPLASLSGGQRQRVAIGRAIYQGASALIADEPVSALDGPMANRVMELLSERFRSALIALHDVDLALRYCNRIVGISDGVIALDEPSNRLSTADILPLY